MELIRLAIYESRLKKIKRQGEHHKQEQAIRDLYAEYWPEKKERKVSNVMLVVIIIAIMLYTVAAFWVQYKTGIPMDATLSTLYYAFWGTELVALATIKNHKTKHGNSYEE